MVMAQIARRTGRIPISGFVADGYEPVRDAFVSMLARGEEQGGAVAATRHGEVGVDLWGGYADRGAVAGRPRPWTEDTLIVVFSATKGLAALLLLKLHEARLPTTTASPSTGQVLRATAKPTSQSARC